MELMYICVDPFYRRHGIGSSLVNHCFRESESMQLPMAVCSEPAAHDFFLTLGFCHTTHVDIDLRKWAPSHSGFGLFRLTGMVTRRQT